MRFQNIKITDVEVALDRLDKQTFANAVCDALAPKDEASQP